MLRHFQLQLVREPALRLHLEIIATYLKVYRPASKAVFVAGSVHRVLKLMHNTTPVKSCTQLCPEQCLTGPCVQRVVIAQLQIPKHSECL